MSAPEMFRDTKGDEEVAPADGAPVRRARKPRKPRPRPAAADLATSTAAVAETVTGAAPSPDPAPVTAEVLDRERQLPLHELDEDLAAAGTVTFAETVVVEDQHELVVAGDVVLEEAIVYEEPEAATSNPLLEPSSPLLARAFTGVARTDGPRRRSRRNGLAHTPPAGDPPAAPEPPG
jgi:hypothetical protein